jgi:hypothetical protein
MIQTGWLWRPGRPPLPIPRTKKSSHGYLAAQSATPQISNYAAARALDSCQGVRMRGPSAVIAIVNSKWAATEPSWE